MKLKLLTLEEEATQKLLGVILSILLAFLVTGVVLLVLGYDPIQVYLVLFHGSLGTPAKLGYTMKFLVPLVFTGLCAVVAYKGGLWNVGGEGQLYMAASAAEIVGIAGIYPPFHLALATIAGIVTGGLWGGLAGFLKARFQADEVVTTIMMNFVATSFVYYLVTGPVRDTTNSIVNVGLPIKVSAQFPQLSYQYGISSTLIAALAVPVIIHFLMQRGTFGFGVTILGTNSLAASYAGVNIRRDQILLMFLSGCMAGFAGVALILGYQFFLTPYLSPGFGFIGIAVALVAGLNALLVVPMAFFFAILYAGGNEVMSQFGIPTQTVAMISAMVILAFLASGPLIRTLRRRIPRH